MKCGVIDRFVRFARNAGFRGTARTLLVLAAFAVLLAREGTGGNRATLAAAAVIGVVLAYLGRELLLKSVRTTAIAMNAVLLLALVAAFAGNRLLQMKEQPVALGLVVAAFLGLYLGSYFWLLSDPRVERV